MTYLPPPGAAAVCCHLAPAGKPPPPRPLNPDPVIWSITSDGLVPARNRRSASKPPRPAYASASSGSYAPQWRITSRTCPGRP